MRFFDLRIRCAREVHLIAFPRENRSKLRLRKAEDRSQLTKYILHTYILITQLAKLNINH